MTFFYLLLFIYLFIDLSIRYSLTYFNYQHTFISRKSKIIPPGILTIRPYE